MLFLCLMRKYVLSEWHKNSERTGGDVWLVDLLPDMGWLADGYSLYFLA